MPNKEKEEEKAAKKERTQLQIEHLQAKIDKYKHIQELHLQYLQTKHKTSQKQKQKNKKTKN